jgi:hypothetical protein
MYMLQRINVDDVSFGGSTLDMFEFKNTDSQIFGKGHQDISVNVPMFKYFT